MYLFPLTCRYPKNEHENDFANGQGFDFERVVYFGELGNEEDMKDDDLLHQEITEVINLGIEKERKKGENRDHAVTCH